MSDLLIDNSKLVETESTLTRRAFVAAATAAGVCYTGALAYPIYRYLNSPVEKSEIMAAIKDVTLDKADELPKGSAMMFKFGPYPAMLIHHENGDWVAFNAVCTHLGCTVQFNKEVGRITCACHGGQYDFHTGENIAGPPPRPLTKFAVKVSKGSVQVTRA